MSSLISWMLGSSPAKQEAQKEEEEEDEDEKKPSSSSTPSSSSSSPTSPVRGTTVSRLSPAQVSADSAAEDSIQIKEETLFRTHCSFYFLDGSKDPAVPILRHPRALLLITRIPSTYNFSLAIYFGARQVLSIPITSAVPFEVDQSNLTLTFVQRVDGAVSAFRLLFESSTDLKSVSGKWSVCVWEHSQKESFDKVVKDQRWVNEADLEMSEAEAKEEEKDNMDWEEDEEEEDAEAVERAARLATPIRGFNSQKKKNVLRTPASNASNKHNDKLAVGIAVNRAFVTRGSAMSVMKHGNEGELEFLTQVPILKDMEGEELNPSQMLLTQGDSKMILLNQADPTRIYEMDVERGKVVSEFKADNDLDWNVGNVSGVTKYAEKTHDQTLMAVNKNSVFALDPRQQGHSKIAQKFVYSTPQKLSTVSTTGVGKVAVASEKGEIKLFNDISKRAKTALPGIGAPIVGLDVTETGDYILATTRHYLLLIRTSVEGRDKSGFDQSMTAASAATPPTRLQVSPSDMLKYDLESLSFTTARFNTGENIDEEWIVTSAGPYVITWNFRKLKINPQRYRYEYQIKKCAENVVVDQFLYGHDDQVVITLPDAVYVEKKSQKSKQRAR